jgi:hypothetical protein
MAQIHSALIFNVGRYLVPLLRILYLLHVSKKLTVQNYLLDKITPPSPIYLSRIIRVTKSDEWDV